MPTLSPMMGRMDASTPACPTKGRRVPPLSLYPFIPSSLVSLPRVQAGVPEPTYVVFSSTPHPTQGMSRASAVGSHMLWSLSQAGVLGPHSSTTLEAPHFPLPPDHVFCPHPPVASRTPVQGFGTFLQVLRAPVSMQAFLPAAP